MHIAQYLAGYFVLGLLWLLTDPTSQKLFYSPGEFLKKDRSFTTTFMILVMIAQFISGLFFPWHQTPQDALITSAGNTIFWFGFLLTTWAKFTMKHNWGSPAQHEIRRQKILVTGGPFRITRNPIYVGLGLMALGASLGIRSIFTPLVFLFFSHLRKMVVIEEQLLLKHFGKRYEEYKREIPRFFI